MKIAMVAPEKLPLPGNGSVEICILGIARELALRHQVTIISREIQGLPATEQLDGITIQRVPAPGSVGYTKAAIRLLSRHTYDVIQVDNRPHSMATIKRAFPNIPIVLYLHSLTFAQPGPSRLALMRKADWIAVNSHSLRQRLGRRFPLVQRQMSVVPLGADLTRFKPAESSEERLRLRKQYGVTKPLSILYVGRLIPGKGVDILIRAMSLLQRQMSVQLVVAGKGPPRYVRRLRDLALKQKVHVSFRGQINHEHIDQLYRAVDFLVCPSQKHEAFGLVNVEAMASGLPVIASDNGGIREIIQSGTNGYLVTNYRHPRSFTSCLHKLANSPTSAQALGEAGRASAVAQFSWARTALHLESIYTRLIRE
ncbi:glycosyltransferase family 1 protein [Paenibacillus sp. PCH8]|uniref:glycosyltransferase family 4 protein n=1 Tax=Paenibacillus sp. PCH8 TaxID=2066524 RepID=UPI000CF852B7|nr:glycosyltransferase family 4 protein [Paenibacillus sp. PCH8]PQP84977.1 glycosyltransferase family 1 protein [Paenibacillus sp. PCH8]